MQETQWSNCTTQGKCIRPLQIAGMHRFVSELNTKLIPIHNESINESINESTNDSMNEITALSRYAEVHF
jgi:hypothetical protein